MREEFERWLREAKSFGDLEFQKNESGRYITSWPPMNLMYEAWCKACAVAKPDACPQLADAAVRLKIISSLERLYFLLSSEETFDFNNEYDIKEGEELKEFIDSIKSSFS